MKSDENLLSFLQHSGSVYNILIDLEGNYLYSNDLYKKIFFKPDTDIQDSNFTSSLIGEDVTLFKDARSECLASPGKSVCVDLRRTREDGSNFWIRWEFCALVLDERIRGLQALGTDASERRRAEIEKLDAQAKLVRERYLLRTLIDHLPDYIYVKDTGSRHILTNKANLELSGARREEDIVGKTAVDYLDEDSALAQIGRDREFLESGQSMSSEEELVVMRNGEKKWLLTTRVPLKNDRQENIGLVGISRDITDRKKIEESLRVSVERSNILSRATNDAVWDWDLVNDVVQWNDALQILFGVRLDDVVKMPDWWEQNIHPDDRVRVTKRIRNHIDKAIENWQDEYRFMCSDGSYKSVFDRGYLMLDKNNKPYRMIGAMVDLTERKKLQEELSTQTISRQRQITEATIMAQERERAEIGRELHDNINQILTTTKMYLDMALTEKDISEELTIKSHSNISTAIEEIRSLSKSLVPPSLGDIGLRAAVQEMINNLKISPKLTITLKTTGIAKAVIPGNIQLMVFRIVQEQMNNVLKHSQATIAEVKLALAKHLLVVTVTDNGVGFDPRTKTKGIGLSNIASRAEVHKGEMEVISSPGEGCILKISIPI